MASEPMKSVKGVKEQKMPKKSFDHMEIRKVKGKDGGHIVTHHHTYDNSSPNMPYMSSPKPAEHIFSKDQGPEMMQHIGKHLGVPSSVPKPKAVKGATSKSMPAKSAPEEEADDEAEDDEEEDA